ncbi:formate dehydrogenase accessory sulfurtransferase FdhD [Ruegeria atlantica]|uniref:formate dehydrogenase accessory sulfurtransferase FdhD n=1 Tax=Ruegeria atlantica TaxID=81569 RepID=UPI0020C1F237|nr:formate dehydrogenase accessory sulfurtransferase FdhD [Ruegeria atlantica]
MTAPFRESLDVHFPESRMVTATRYPYQASQITELAQEVPVAVVFNGTTAAVMMASPVDIHDFALGFAMTEGFIAGQVDIADYEQVAHKAGIEARFWLKEAALEHVSARRRAMMGPVGCGLCGIDSLEQVTRPLPCVVDRSLRIEADEVTLAPEFLRDHQLLHDQTRSAHAAGFLMPGKGIVMAREDVGRHNALDKLMGALIQAGINPVYGAVVMTSRVSLELVQKTAAMGCPMLIAVSSPTAIAVELADQASITLVANAKRSECCVFTHEYRISTKR